MLFLLSFHIYIKIKMAQRETHKILLSGFFPLRVVCVCVYPPILLSYLGQNGHPLGGGGASRIFKPPFSSTVAEKSIPSGCCWWWPTLSSISLAPKPRYQWTGPSRSRHHIGKKFSYFRFVKKKSCQFCICTIFLHYELSNVSSNWHQSKYKVTFFTWFPPKWGFKCCCFQIGSWVAFVSCVWFYYDL